MSPTPQEGTAQQQLAVLGERVRGLERRSDDHQENLHNLRNSTQLLTTKLESYVGNVKVIDKLCRDMYDGDRNAPGMTVRIAEQEGAMKEVQLALTALGFEDGMAREFITFKTEIITSVENASTALARSNSRMNMIIGALGLVVAIGILLCTIFALALTHNGAKSMLLSSDPTFTAAATLGEK
jgi:hypothetical protein